MIAISVSAFRNNMRKYLDQSKKERVIIQCRGEETFELVPGERISDADRFFSDPTTSARISHSFEQYASGQACEFTPENQREFFEE